MRKAINILILVLIAFILVVPVFAFAARLAGIATYGVTDITLNSATLQGAVTSMGDCDKATVWFEYGLDTSYGSETPEQTRTATTPFSATISNLSACTTYHFWAVGRSNKGISYGSDRFFTTECPSFDVETSVQNLSRGDTTWYKALWAKTGDKLLYKLKLKSTGDVMAANIMLLEELPPNVIYEGNLEINGVSSARDVSRGAVKLGNLMPGQTKEITFEAKVGPEANLNYGRNDLVDTALAYTSDFSATDTSKIMVTRAAPAGAAAPAPVSLSPTQVSTGITNNILNSLLLPLSVAFLLVWIFKSKLIGFDKWASARVKVIDDWHAQKKLKRMIRKMK